MQNQGNRPRTVFRVDDCGTFGATWFAGPGRLPEVVVIRHRFGSQLDAETWVAENLGGPVTWRIDRDAEAWARTIIRAGRSREVE